MISAGPRTNDSRPAVAPGPALVHTAAETAVIIGGTCKASWLKQQAREGRIPYVRLGGAYNFTDAHIAAIIAAFERLPADPAKPAAPKATAPPPARPAAVTHLTARRPRTGPRRDQVTA